METPVRDAVVAHLKAAGSATTSEVARALGLNPGSVHRALARLQECGSVKSRRGTRPGAWGGGAVRQWAMVTSEFAAAGNVIWA